jgi:hypothetical protein
MDQLRLAQTILREAACELPHDRIIAGCAYWNDALLLSASRWFSIASTPATRSGQPRQKFAPYHAAAGTLACHSARVPGCQRTRHALDAHSPPA